MINALTMKLCLNARPLCLSCRLRKEWDCLQSSIAVFFPSDCVALPFVKRVSPLLQCIVGILETVVTWVLLWKMAGETSSRCTLLQITSEWYLDYCICQLWKEFKAKRSLSACWRDAIQGKAMRTTQYGVSNASCPLLHCLLLNNVLNILCYFLQIFWKIDGLI